MSCVVSKGLCDELITRPEESYRMCCVVVCDLETSRMGAPYIYDISSLKVEITFKRNLAATATVSRASRFVVTPVLYSIKRYFPRDI